ncbi:hypothetical protein QBC33DRAFT_570208 [Phialemonium atrogriseum]|uniref:Autophagy-related protein 28 n=1 Tax=Phialemonium atrogriseum TaxID=1093897 RepID=A0AAJ0C0I2_9PEZI|nr:uncharacterized protein QBC33DRAFT_570208 [Phialemonium atrogriseum]KAK1767252.1 hypothetical protein QBC33DRAFT_570208 [Phialemonium atrogriseum]
MASKSSFLPRLPFSRTDGPGLPFHNSRNLPIRKRTSEYDLSDLSPRPDDDQSPLNLPLPGRKSSPRPQSSSPTLRYSDRADRPGHESKINPGPLFSGPPPPIATSTLLYRDEEDRGMERRPAARYADNSSFARNALSSVSSVLFDRGSPSHTKDNHQAPEPDTIWRSLQRREMALQNDLQHLLDAQSTGLAAHLDPTAPSAPSTLSSASTADDSASNSSSTHTEPFHARGAAATAAAYSAGGGVVPVRQPRRRPVGLRGARAGLARVMVQLAGLKAEEDAGLAAALGARRRALAQLRRLAGRRDGIAGELRALERDDGGGGGDPLARELRGLGEERRDVVAEMAELEERLVGLRSRKRWLDGKMEDVRNRREAGLSGYKGALREVEVKVSGLLTRPPVKPLDLAAITSGSRRLQGGGSVDGASADGQSPGGVEFLRMRPERRTVEMARDWWESEIEILERRKIEVDEERNALEEGAEVWKEAVKLVSDFESGLRREMKDELGAADKGKQKAPTPEEAMHAQLDKMAGVIVGLAQQLRTAEEKGWNLLICAIGAELEAFKEAEHMLREALRAAGFDDDDDDGPTPRLGRSVSLKTSAKRSGSGDGKKLVDVAEDRSQESDNEVPPDLLVSHEEDHDDSLTQDHEVGESPEQEDSENEVPLEFLAEHHEDEEDDDDAKHESMSKAA